jgi:S-DNA-T family DNA segregation ATPase FtsK/SpoIIIE
MKTATSAQTILTPRNRARKRAPALPPIDNIFEQGSEAKYGATDANRKARVIEETLSNFGIPAKVIEINAGPTITQFGLEPGFVARRGSDGVVRQRKVSVSRIAALQHDLELALAAAPIRIETPVPGRPIVGIEVPNESVSVVALRGILESDAFKKKKSPLKIALGRDVSGTANTADLGTMPHLLIAGATGSGKSVCINAIIACLLYDNSPDDLRLIMVDPKRVELVNFNGIPHLLGPVVVNPDEVVACLRWVVREMDNRFTLFAKNKVRNIDMYNEKMNETDGDNTMPYIIVLIDELADLMLAAPDETEKLLTRLAQMARATGIHLVIATQRPSVDVVTGLIKANFPSRISFAVTSSVDSRVVLDMPGAEKLLGRGDMLYMASDSSKLMRMQGCFVSDDELARLVHFWREKAITDMRDVAQEPPWKSLGGDGKEDGDEAIVQQATELVRQFDRTSISFLQRKLGIGYPRAARLMDQLEERGIVGPDEGGGKSRAVLVTDEDAKNFEAEESPKKKR